MKTKYNWGILGLGNMAHKFCDDLNTIPEAKIYSVASRNKIRSESFANKYNAVNFYECYEELISDRNIDIIYIATPHAYHYKHVLSCLERRIPVLCEKPLGIKLSEVKNLIEIAKKYQTLLIEGLWTMYLPIVQEVKGLLNNKIFGELMAISSSIGFKASTYSSPRLFNKELGGGAILDIGVYSIMYPLLLFEYPSSIFSTSVKRNSGVDEISTIILKHPNEKVSQIFLSIISGSSNLIEFICEDGRIIVQNSLFPHKIYLIKNGKTQDVRDFSDKCNYKYEIQDVINCLSNGRCESKIMNWSYSIAQMSIIETIQKLNRDEN